MAVTHADLAPGRGSTELGSKMGAFLIILTILCGLLCFILCLIAESTRSQVRWMVGRKGGVDECVYSGSGKTALVCGASAFLVLAAAMVVEHFYLLVAVSKSASPPLLAWDPTSAPARALSWQAGFFFVATWACFAVGEILLLIGVSVESGHLKGWSTPRPTCLVLRQGLFSAAGVLGLATVFLAAGLYITALRVQRMCQEQENVRQEVLAASAFYASPPASPRRHPLAPIAGENHDRIGHMNGRSEERPSSTSVSQLQQSTMSAFGKQYSNLV
ncbi:uncharacterized protein LOC131151053 [Malania oleifera]|uniref:uncharacterized protein LOC131151053 n=1 Tax=Malania oleifera TaxID=397392 RepID=UPI0025ADD816|nr:uncharacterized protein LOC131151053 [Malania oleifera]XP_057958211.1 uncharacterized protein LOC131151053 [Malania oleifera]XP_057958212.1 uncharacterized protein LOC131151053 [Malania oleifera]